MNERKRERKTNSTQLPIAVGNRSEIRGQCWEVQNKCNYLNATDDVKAARRSEESIKETMASCGEK